MQLSDWPLGKVALLLLIGLTLLTKTSFDPLGRDQSFFRLSALVATESSEKASQDITIWLCKCVSWRAGDGDVGMGE